MSNWYLIVIKLETLIELKLIQDESKDEYERLKDEDKSVLGNKYMILGLDTLGSSSLHYFLLSNCMNITTV